MIKVGILGATGSVGQRFIQLLDNHPWFKITELAASEKSAGKPYGEAANWFLEEKIPDSLSRMIVKNCDPSQLDCDVVFSGLDSSVAGGIEENFAAHGFAVISNSKNHRYDDDVPLLIPEVNPGHLEIIKIQQRNRGWRRGFIITNPNCSAVGLVMALKPLRDKFGVKKVFVTTMQALSGAGYPGVSSLDILDNVVPFIDGEEAKLEMEPNKILGSIDNGKFRDADISISAHCNRVNVLDGHTECVSVKCERALSKDPREMIASVQNCLCEFSSEAQILALPSAPLRPIHIMEQQNRPQPRRDRNTDKGMAVCVGRIRPCNILDVRFTLLSHNTIRGAAGAAILNAELLFKKGYFDF